MRNITYVLCNRVRSATSIHYPPPLRNICRRACVRTGDFVRAYVNVFTHPYMLTSIEIAALCCDVPRFVDQTTRPWTVVVMVIQINIRESAMFEIAPTFLSQSQIYHQSLTSLSLIIASLSQHLP